MCVPGGWLPRLRGAGWGGAVSACLQLGSCERFPPELEEEVPTLDYNDQIEREDYEDCE